MWPWLKRVLGASAVTAPAVPSGRAAAAAPVPSAPRPRPQPPAALVPPRARAPLVNAEAAAALAGTDPEVATGPGPRCALVGRRGEIAGFELRLSAAAERFVAARPDSPGATLHHAGLLAAAGGVAAAGRVALVRMPAAMLARPPLLRAVAAGTWLQLDDLAALPADAAAALRSRGARLGVADGPPMAEPAADFVVVTAGPGGLDTLLLAAKRWREALPQVAIVGRGFEHLEDLEAALRGAVVLAGGHIARSREAPPPRPPGAVAQRICELMNQLAQDRDTAVVAEAVRDEATLTYRLLRYANSPAIGARQGVESVDTAVALLGRRELQRWLSVQMMLSADGARPAARALEEAALFRGRLLEDIASSLGDTHPGAHFTLGLLSLIEPLLQLPLADAIAPLRLADEARAALLRRQGPWAARLDLADALDAGDMAAAESLALALGLPEGSLAGIVDDAWGWSGLARDDGAGA